MKSISLDPGLEILVSISSGRSPVSRMFTSWKRKFDLDLKLGCIYIYSVPVPICPYRIYTAHRSSGIETALKLSSRQLVNTILIDTIL